MQLHEAFEVTEVYGVQHVNEAVRKGWRLLAVTAISDPHDPAKLVNCFVLGKKKPADPLPNIDPAVLR